MAVRKRKAAKKRPAKKAARKRTTKTLFGLAASNKTYKAAKKRVLKAQNAAKKAYKKAVTMAKRKLKTR